MDYKESWALKNWCFWTVKKAERQRTDAFELCWRRLLRVPWTARRSNLSILKEISLEYLLEGQMLKLELQCFGHLMWRTDSLEKTLMLGKIENESCSVMSDSLQPHGLYSPWNSPGQTLQWVVFAFSRGSSQPRSPALQVDSLPAEPQGKPKNTGVHSLSLPQWIFPIQESNQSLLHSRRILNQLSYQGSPGKDWRQDKK